MVIILYSRDVIFTFISCVSRIYPFDVDTNSILKCGGFYFIYLIDRDILCILLLSGLFDLVKCIGKG